MYLYSILISVMTVVEFKIVADEIKKNFALSSTSSKDLYVFCKTWFGWKPSIGRKVDIPGGILPHV